MNAKSMARTKNGISVIAGVMGFIICGMLSMVAQTLDPDELQIGPAILPLVDLALQLEKVYGMPITYEDAILEWQGDMELSEGGGTMLVSKHRSFILPREVNPRWTPVISEVVLNKMIDAYNTQTDGSRFKVFKSAFGLHIIPKEVRDASGRYVEAFSLLDTRITIEPESRTPKGHIQAICDAVTKVTGIELVGNAGYINELFKPSLVKRGRTIAAEDLEKCSFEWRAKDIIARDAILQLLDRSASPVTWKLTCAVNQARCYLNMGGL